MPIFVGRVPSCLVATVSTRVCIYVIKEDLLLHRLKEDLMVACDGELAGITRLRNHEHFTPRIYRASWQRKIPSTFDASCYPN